MKKSSYKSIIGNIACTLTIALAIATVAFASSPVYNTPTFTPAFLEREYSTTEEVVVDIIEEDFQEESEEIIMEQELFAEEILDEIIVEEPQPLVHIVSSGDTLWKIAKEYYDDGNLYTQVAEDNDLNVNGYIYPGDEILIWLEPEVVEVVSTDDAISVDILGSDSPSTHALSLGGGDVPAYDPDETPRNNPDGIGIDVNELEYVGTYKITGYDPTCEHCCGWSTGIGSSGREIEVGISVACNDIPSGTWIYVEGYGVYRVDDTGGMGGGTVDIAAHTHDTCYSLTASGINVYIIG